MKGRSVMRRMVLSSVICTVLLAAVGASSASADFGFAGASARITGADGQPLFQAGAHPDISVTFALNEKADPDGGSTTAASLRDLRATLPPGFVGDPTAIGTCRYTELATPEASGALCPIDSQVGRVKVRTTEPEGSTTPYIRVGLFNMVHPPDAPAAFGFNFGGAAVLLIAEVHPDDYSIGVDSTAITQAETTFEAETTFWGVPWASVHDPERESNRVPGPPPGSSVSGDPRPFLSNPTSCPEAPFRIGLAADSWQQPGVFATTSVEADPSGNKFIVAGCNRLTFAPSVAELSAATRTSSPSGLNVDIKVPQNQGVAGLSTPQVKRTTVTLPAGFTISPAAAAGLAGCSEAEIGLGSNDAPTCPGASGIGTVKIKTPLLEEELEGEVYLARQKQNPFGSNYALYLTAKGPGFYIKLPGKIEADPVTGQLTTTFDNQPQLPYEEVSLQLEGGAQAPLVTPSDCGTYSAHVEMTSWASPAPVQMDPSLEIDEACGPHGFLPRLRAGTSDPTGGSFSPFLLQVNREDGEADLSRITATLPPGLLAKLAGVPLCGEGQAATGDCSSASQVGRTTVGAGAGPSPLYVPEAGKAPTAVYLAGPYKGAPYSLVVKVPAQAGPFDLGAVVVRNALKVDPFTTQVTAESDPLPQILEGVPISYRDVRVEVNRPEFTVNPTNCSQLAVTSSLASTSGQTAAPKAPFAATNCERLAFKPRLKLQLKGSTRRTGKPALKAVLTYPQKGAYANIARAQVNLPGSEFLEQANLNKTCTRPVLMEGGCPKSTVYGKAKAWSPLLDKPLEGPVYLVGGFGYQLPALVADLGGQIRVILKGKIDTGADHGLRTTFEGVPDARVSRFVLQMKGGKKYGLLVNSEDICKKPQKLKAAFTAQNGKTTDFRQRIAVTCRGSKTPPRMLAAR